ncbi:hypothetical protein [Streptomyces endophyticus]|uniref:Uncharacterized protein n=1 Tax=Streptomyces endophyticus TaxID=714166 RepID=A0ABU6FG09_9ACTN|nr:hypothetical protein [Streptomyces endophyticus]MEB8342996.1 hypothetical protein [Streptomyces endophyticus]
MSYRLRRGGAGRTVPLAGWLFADLLLLLFVIALGSLPKEKQPDKPDPPAKVAEQGLVLKPCSLTVHTGSAASVRGQLAKQLRSADVDSRMAGFVLSFGTAPEPGPGQAAAERVNSAITKMPRFKNAPKRGYWKGGPSGSVRIDVFFLATADGGTKFPKGCRSSDG